MNASTWRRLAMPVLALLASSALSSDEVARLTPPWLDPLRVNPPQLETGKTLPGDASPYECDASAAPMPPMPLALAQAVDLALCHNPQVQSAWASIKLQAAQSGEARAAYWPTITVGASRLRQDTSSTASPVALHTERTAQYTTLSWRLLDMGGRSANRRAADALLDAALASHDAALQKTMANTIGAYFDAQTARAVWVAKEKGAALARQTWETAQKRETGGAAARSDTLHAQTAWAKAELESARARGNHEQALSALATILGLPAPAHAAGLQLAEEHTEPVHALQQALSHWLRLAQEQHPALLAARSQLDAAREKLIAARSEGLPSVDYTQSQYRNGLPNQGLSGTASKQSYSGLTLNIPLFEGFARGYKLRAAQAQIELKAAELRETETQILGDVAKAYAEATAALRNLASSRRLHEAAGAALDEVGKKYTRGVSDILDMLEVQTSVAEAEQERVRALAQWRSARLRLWAASGLLGRHELAAPALAAD